MIETTTIQEVETSKMVVSAFEFWFSDKGHIRSPFPEYIREETRRIGMEKFSEWLQGLKEGADQEVNDAVLSEKLEEIVFATAVELVKSEDERITLEYPNLPRVGDLLRVGSEEEPSHLIKSRRIEVKDEDRFFCVQVVHQESGKQTEVKFHLPY